MGMVEKAMRKVKQLGVWLALICYVAGSAADAQQKSTPKPVDVVQAVEAALTQRIVKDRKGQSVAVTLDTSAPYSPSAATKGLRGTGTLLNKKTNKREMFAYDVQIDAVKGTTARLSYRPMKGVVFTEAPVSQNYPEEMAHSAIRDKIRRERNAQAKVVFYSVTMTPVSSSLVQVGGEGSYIVGKTGTRFVYSAVVDAQKGTFSKVIYRALNPKTQSARP
jgi:hypothetical protein